MRTTVWHPDFKRASPKLQEEGGGHTKVGSWRWRGVKLCYRLWAEKRSPAPHKSCSPGDANFSFHYKALLGTNGMFDLNSVITSCTARDPLSALVSA